MSAILDASTAPFDRLTSEEAEYLRAAMDVVYFRPGETIVAEGARARRASIIVIKGCVEEREQGELVGLLGPKDFFDSRAVVQGVGVSGFIAREETLCSLAPPRRRAAADQRQSPFRRLLLQRHFAQARRARAKGRIDPDRFA